MIHIDYSIQPSPLHGIGLFAGQDIQSGQRIYTPSPILDVDITPEQFSLLDKREQCGVRYYGYLNHKTGLWHVAFDAIRVLNHGSKTEGAANVTQDEEMVMTALRDINEGEELLQDYEEIYPHGSEHFERIRNSKEIR